MIFLKFKYIHVIHFSITRHCPWANFQTLLNLRFLLSYEVLILIILTPHCILFPYWIMFRSFTESCSVSTQVITHFVTFAWNTFFFTTFIPSFLANSDFFKSKFNVTSGKHFSSFPKIVLSAPPMASAAACYRHGHNLCELAHLFPITLTKEVALVQHHSGALSLYTTIMPSLYYIF